MTKSAWSMAVSARWVLSIGIAGAVLYGSSGPVRPWPHYALVAAVLVGNGTLAWYWSRIKSNVIVWLVVVADVVAVTMTIALTRQASADLYLFYFVVLLAAATTQSWRAFVVVTTLTCALYGAVLYAAVGERLWHDAALLLRVPFLLCVSIFVGLAANRARAERVAARRMAEALAEIGTLAIGWGSTRQVLYEIAHHIQTAFAVERCSLILFDDDLSRGFLAASGDDPRVDAREIPLKKYPELRAAMRSKELVECQADGGRSLWRRVELFLPERSPFRSLLVVPVLLRGVVRGVYFLRCHDVRRHYTDSEKTFCRIVAMMTSTFVHERELERELAQAAHFAEALDREPESAAAAASTDAEQGRSAAGELVAHDSRAMDAEALAEAAESLFTVRPAA